MYELRKITERSFYIDCPSKIGVIILASGEICLIDSSNGPDAAKKAVKAVSALGAEIRCVINTHSNADHIGGNAYLAKSTGCDIFAPRTEDAFIRDTLLEPSFLYGGFPLKPLRSKFLMAKESVPLPTEHERFPSELEIIPLPGHFFNMIGVLTGDKTAYIADCVASRQTIEKYRLPFIYDVGEYLNTLEMLKTLDADAFVPSHAEVCSDIAALCEINRKCVEDICEDILSAVNTPKCFDVILKELFDKYSLTLTIEQYALAGSTVRSFLSYLYEQGLAEFFTEGNMLTWHRK